MKKLIHWFLGKPNMSQAKVLNEREIRKCLLYIAARRHASRNRAMFLFTHWTGARVCEVAALRISHVLSRDGEIRDEVRLTSAETKGDRSRTIVLSQRMRDELKTYLKERFGVRDLLPITMTDLNRALFHTQKNPDRGFTANTMCQKFFEIYHGAGVEGGSSHSGRRGFLTGLADRGVSVRVLQELANHKSMAVTQRYIDVNPAMLRKAVELL